MRGNSGKNISSPGIAVPRIQMNTAKAHIHIAMRCELTAVFLYTISIGYLGEVQKAVALFTIFRGAKIMEIFHASKTFSIYLRTHNYFLIIKCSSFDIFDRAARIITMVSNERFIFSIYLCFPNNL